MRLRPSRRSLERVPACGSHQHRGGPCGLNSRGVRCPSPDWPEVALANGVSENRAEESHGSRGCACSAANDCPASRPGLHIGFGLAADNVTQKTPEISSRDFSDGPRTEKRDHMPLDPSPIGVNCGRLFRLLPASNDQALLGSLEIFPTKLLDGHGVPIGGPVGRRVLPMRHIGQKPTGLLAPLLGRQNAIAANCKPPAPTVPVSILQDEGLGAAGLRPQAKPRQLVVPKKQVGSAGGRRRVDGPLGQFWHRVSTG